jgi:hypothetical protein
LIVSVYVRHTPDCPARKDRHSRRCRCPKWLYFTYLGKKSRQSARTRSWEQAERNARVLEREYEARERDAFEGHQPKSKEPTAMTVEDAVDRHLDDKRQQNCAEETLTKH